MDFGRGLSYIRQDPNWIVKVLLGSVINMVPILNFAGAGYGLRVLSNVYEGRETPLPEWGDNFGDYFLRGLLGTIIQVIYFLPVLILGCGIEFASIGAAIAASSGDQASAAPPTALLCLGPLIFVLAIVIAPLAQIALARYAVTNEFGAAMRFGEVFAEFRRNPMRWYSIILMMIPVLIVFGIVAPVTCGLGSLL